MADPLHHFALDWGWPALSEAERAIARRHEARAQADPRSHTLKTLTEALSVASLELPGRDLRFHAEDAYGEYTVVARDGRCDETSRDSFDDAGRFPDSLTADDYRAAGITRLSVGLYWPEAMIHGIEEQAKRLDKSLSWIVQRAWAMADGVAAPAPKSWLGDGGHRRQSVFLPVEIYAQLAELAAREDRSMSFLVQRAVASAWAQIVALPADAK